MGMLSNYLLGTMILIFIAQLTIDGFTENLIFIPELTFVEPWRVVTSIFLHGGITHLFFNGYALFLFGNILESKASQKDYLAIFFGAGIVGAFLYYLLVVAGISPALPALGASGAIYGILGAVAVLFPNMRIYMWFFPMRMREAAILWALISIVGTFDTASGIGHAAHLGGLVFGWIYATLKKVGNDTEKVYQNNYYKEDGFV